MQSPRCSDLRSSLREENAVLRATRLGWASLSNPSPRNVGGLPYGVTFYNVLIDSKQAAAMIYTRACTQQTVTTDQLEISSCAHSHSARSYTGLAKAAFDQAALNYKV